MTYTAHAKRWRLGWELHVDGVGVTQVRTLDRAEQQVRDLIETMTDEPCSSDVNIIVELGSLSEDVARARRATEEAARARSDAARQTKEVVARLREAGLSVTDIAATLGVSRGRVSQLV